MQKVTVQIGNNVWDRYHDNEQMGGSSQRDSIFLEKVVNALENAIEQAKFELQSSLNKFDTTSDVSSSSS